MPTKPAFTATTASVRVFTVPKHRVGRISSIALDNGTTAQVRVHLDHVFTPDVSAAVAAPAANQTEEVAYLNVGAGLTGEMDHDSLKDLRLFGRVQAICDGTWATARVVVSYHLE